MFQSFIIMFRETLEAALVVGIVFSYLKKTRQGHHAASVWLGIGAGVALSVVGAIAFSRLAGGFSGAAEGLFEGMTMLIGAALLTTMILWMMNRSGVAEELEQKIDERLSTPRRLGLFLLVMVSVLREGIESVIFLSAARFASGESNLVGAVLGIAVAIGVGYLIMLGTFRMGLRHFFAATNLLLMLFAAGLVAHGVHELQEAGLVPFIIEHVWDINPPVAADGGYPALHENGSFGSVAKALLGYNGNPSLVELMAYVAYLIGIALAWMRLSSRRVLSVPDNNDQ